MKARLVVLLFATATLPVVAMAQSIDGLEVTHAKIVARYGSTELKTRVSRGEQSLLLSFNDKRYLGRWTGFPDSALAMAKFTVTVLPPGYHPAFVTVSITTADSVVGGVRRFEERSKTFAVAKLK